MIEQHVLQCCGVSQQAIEDSGRQRSKCFIAGCKESKRPFSGEGIFQPGRSDGFSQGRERLIARNHFADGGRHSFFCDGLFGRLFRGRRQQYAVDQVNHPVVTADIGFGDGDIIDRDNAIRSSQGEGCALQRLHLAIRHIRRQQHAGSNVIEQHLA